MPAVCMLHASSVNLAGFHTCCMPITTCIQQSSVQLCWLTCSSLYACNPRWGWCNLRPPDSKRIPICDIFGKCNFPSLHEAIYFLHVICKPVTCNLHVYYMPAISSLHALCMLHVQLFQYACNLHFACAVTRMLFSNTCTTHAYSNHATCLSWHICTSNTNTISCRANYNSLLMTWQMSDQTKGWSDVSKCCQDVTL